MKPNAAIYIAGGEGVAGNSIVRAFKKRGYQNLLAPSHKELDLCNQAAVDTFFQQWHPEYVFFTAVKMGSLVYRREHPADILGDNLLMQTNVLRAAHRYGVKKLLYMSSDFIYPDTDSGILKEEDFLSGAPSQKDLPYTLAKMAGIKLCDYYREQFGRQYFTVVPCAFFGIRSSFDLQRANVIGALIRRFYEAKQMDAKELVLWGTGKPVKEFLYCDDIADACIFLMEHYEQGGHINIGSGDGGISIMEAAQVIRQVVGFQGEIVCDLTKPDGIMRRVMDSSRMQAMGWKPQYSFQEAIERTYGFFLETQVGCATREAAT